MSVLRGGRAGTGRTQTGTVLETSTHNLAIPRTSLIGRDREAAELCDLVARADHRLLTLTGVGGCGKTRLALRVASDLRGSFPDGVWLAELAAVADESLLPQVVASSVGTFDAADVSPLQALLAFLRSRAALLVLDNCEHVIDACVNLAEQLLSGCPNLRILATSREPLQIAGEQQWRVGPLEIPSARDFNRPDVLVDCPSVRLFVERARAVDPRFALSDENVGPLAQICTRLEGIPLALELAAARVRVLSVAEILERLDDCLRLLTGGARAQPSRQQTLVATLDWSYHLLTEPERAVFRRLAVFRGGCGIDLAEAVCAGGGIVGADVLDVVSRLADKSLLVSDHQGRTSRLRMLEPVRQYAERCLEAAGEVVQTRERHRTVLAALAEEAAESLRGPAQVRWLARLDHEQDNLREALRWAESQRDGTAVARLADALAPFWEARSNLSEGRRWLTTALGHLTVDPEVAPTRTKLLLGAGRLAHLAGEYDEAQRLDEESLALARVRGDRAGVAAALTHLGIVHRFQLNLQRSEQVLTEGLSCYRDLDDRWGTAFALLNLGCTARPQGALARSRELFAESLAMFHDLGDQRQIAIIQTRLGLAALDERDPSRAIAHYSAALASHAELGDRWFISYDLMGIAAAFAAQARFTRAARLLGAAHALGEAAGDSLTKVVQAAYGSLVEDVRARLSEAVFARFWAEGRAMTIDRAVSNALDEGDTAEGTLDGVSDPLEAAGGQALTPREQEIAALIGKGCRTDHQIAERLTITVATAGVHVRNIREKLGLHSRWQIADWARTHGLTHTAPST